MIKYIYGLLLSILIAFIAYFLAKVVPIGGVTISIIIGIVVANVFKVPSSCNVGIDYSEKIILSFAIALMGINLDFTILASLGLKTIILIIISIYITIYSAVYIGRYFKINIKLALLLGIGNGICGASAIAATAPVIKANKNFIGLSIGVVNLLGTIGIFFLPLIALIFGLNEIDSGILIGNTLQSIGQVTAAGFSISDTTGISATTVKMGRVLLLTFVVLILIYIFSKQDNDEIKVVKFPKFILFFILFYFILFYFILLLLFFLFLFLFLFYFFQ